MGFFSSMFGGHKPAGGATTKMKIMGLAASTIDYVIQDVGLSAVISGSLVLDQNLQPSFQSGRPKLNANTIVVVPLGDLDEAKLLKSLVKLGLEDSPGLSMLVDDLVRAAAREFEAQCPEYAKLDTGDIL